MLVIKKVSKEDPAAAFSAAFTSPVSHLANGNKATTIVPSVYKNLVPKPAAPPSKVWGFPTKLVKERKTSPFISESTTQEISWNRVVSRVAAFIIETSLLLQTFFPV